MGKNHLNYPNFVHQLALTEDIQGKAYHNLYQSILRVMEPSLLSKILCMIVVESICNELFIFSPFLVEKHMYIMLYAFCVKRQVMQYNFISIFSWYQSLRHKPTKHLPWLPQTPMVLPPPLPLHAHSFPTSLNSF
jgi:hypothetical protein